MVTLTVNGGARADVKIGQPVRLTGVIEAPPSGGGIISAEWDYDGSGSYVDAETFTDLAPIKTVRRTRTFDKPGTSFVVLRVVSQRKEAMGTPFAKMRNLGRLRALVRSRQLAWETAAPSRCVSWRTGNIPVRLFSVLCLSSLFFNEGIWWLPTSASAKQSRCRNASITDFRKSGPGQARRCSHRDRRGALAAFNSTGDCSDLNSRIPTASCLKTAKPETIFVRFNLFGYISHSKFLSFNDGTCISEAKRQRRGAAAALCSVNALGELMRHCGGIGVSF